MGMGLKLPKSEGTRGHRRRDVVMAEKSGPGDKSAPKKKKMTSAAWQEAKALILARRGRLGLGLALMLVNRLSGLVLPALSKYLIDDVIGKSRADLLMPLAVAAGAATLGQAGSSVSPFPGLGGGGPPPNTEKAPRGGGP